MKPITPKNNAQREFIRSIAENEIILVEGPSGTGKDYVSCAMALEYLYRDDKPIQNIILTGPTIHVGKGIGFFPGDAQDKSSEYLHAQINTIIKLVGDKEYKNLLRHAVIQLFPLPLIRGASIDNSFILCTESQNATYAQIKCLLTRIGENSKMVINGDFIQSDLPGEYVPYWDIFEKLQNAHIQGIGHMTFTNNDIVRNGLISKILSVI